MSTSEITIAFAIAILYPCVFYKAADVFTRDEKMDKSCRKKKSNPVSYFDYEIDENCQKEKEELINDQAFKINFFLILVGLLGLGASGFIQTPSTKMGISFGGLFCIIFSTVMYWSRYKEKIKLLILAIALLVVITLSLRLYKIEKISDVIVPDYGKLSIK